MENNGKIETQIPITDKDSQEIIIDVVMEGKSAYDLAVERGFDGTLEEWLLSLHGKDGKDADVDGIQAQFDTVGARLDSTDAQLNDIEQDFTQHKLDYAEDIGTVANLTTTSKEVVGAVNELDEAIALKADLSEIEAARGTEPTLGARLDSTDAQLNNMTQDFTQHKLDYAKLSAEMSGIKSRLNKELPTFFYERLGTLANEITETGLVLKMGEVIITGSELIDAPSASFTDEYYRINAQPILDMDRVIKQARATSSDGDFPLNVSTSYSGNTRQFFAFSGTTPFSVERTKIDSMTGDTVLEKAKKYFDLYPVTILYKLDSERVIDVSDLTPNTQELISIINKLKGKVIEYELKKGDISLAGPFTSNYSISEIGEYYRHTNSGTFRNANYFRQKGLQVTSGRTYFIDLTYKMSHNAQIRIGFGTNANNSTSSTWTGDVTRVMTLITPDADYSSFGVFAMSIDPESVGHYCEIHKDSGYYDLTEIFGAGSEPTETEIMEVLAENPDSFKYGTIKADYEELKMKKLLEAVNRPIGGYYYRTNIVDPIPLLSYADFMSQTWEVLRADHPDYITREVVTKDTSETYDIYEYTFTPENYKRTVFLMSGVHGNEYEAFWSLFFFMKNITEFNYSHERLRDLRHDTRFVVIPIDSPWSMQNNTRYNSRTIDPNTNYDVNFGEEGYASGGEFAFSEKEALAVKMVGDKYNWEFAFFADVHTDPYTPLNGNYVTIVPESILWDEGKKLTLDEISYLKNEYDFETVPRPNIVNVSTGNGAWRYFELVKNVPALIWETSVGTVAGARTPEMVTVGVNWLTNVITEMLKFIENA